MSDRPTIEEIEQALAKITPGDYEDLLQRDGSLEIWSNGSRLAIMDQGIGPDAYSNAEFFASAPTFIRFLLSQLKEPCENCKEMQRALTQVARENRSLEKRCVSLAAAEARGYAEGIERAANTLDNCSCGSGPTFRSENMRHHTAECSRHLAAMIRALSPIPYADKVEAERERIANLIRETRRQYTVETEGAYPLLVAVLNDLLTAIDAKEGD